MKHAIQEMLDSFIHILVVLFFAGIITFCIVLVVTAIADKAEYNEKIKIEEKQFERLISALETIAEKGAAE